MTVTLDGTEEGLLLDICAHPEDDGLRLIYADWLEEHDREQRAAYIRVQVELARLEEDANCDSSRHADLVRQQTELLTQENFWEWFGSALTGVWPEIPPLELKQASFACLGPPHGPKRIHSWKLTLRRGFFNSVGFYGATLRRHGRKLVRCQPVGYIYLWDADSGAGYVGEVGDSPVWTRCTWTCYHSHHLPGELYDLLVAGEELHHDVTCADSGPASVPVRLYATDDHANDDLSRACIRWCWHN